MATNALAGYKGFLTTSTATGGTATRVAEIMDWTMSVEHNEIDATSHDSSGTREVIQGVDMWNGSAELLHVQSEATHQELFDVLVGKTLIDFEFVPTGSTADGSYSASGFITGYELSAPGEDALGASLSFVGSGQLVRNSSST